MLVGAPSAQPRAKALGGLEDPVPPWPGGDLRVRRRRGTGGTESSQVNGLAEGKASEDFLGSSSGYSSEDDFVGRWGLRGKLAGDTLTARECGVGHPPAPSAP